MTSRANDGQTRQPTLAYATPDPRTWDRIDPH
jgi:hypothetical protein